MKPMDRERFEQDDVTRAASIAVKSGNIRVQDILKDGAYWYCFNEGKLHDDTRIDEFINTYTTKNAPISRTDAKQEISYTDPVGTGKGIDLIGVFAATLEMTADEFDTFRTFAKDGTYLIAITEN